MFKEITRTSFFFKNCPFCAQRHFNDRRFFGTSIARLNKKHELYFPPPVIPKIRNPVNCSAGIWGTPRFLKYKKIWGLLIEKKRLPKKIIIRQSGASPRAESRTWMWMRITSLKEYTRLLFRFLAECRFGSD